MLQKTWKSNLNAKWFWRFTKTDIKAPPIGCWHKMFPLWWHKLSSLCKFYSISYCYEGIKGLCQFMTEQQNANIDNQPSNNVWKYFEKHHFCRLFISPGNILCMFCQSLLYKNSIAHTESTIQRLGFFHPHPILENTRKFLSLIFSCKLIFCYSWIQTGNDFQFSMFKLSLVSLVPCLMLLS